MATSNSSWNVTPKKNIQAVIPVSPGGIRKCLVCDAPVISCLGGYYQTSYTNKGTLPTIEQRLKAIVNVNVNDDDSELHSSHMCKACYRYLTNIEKCKSKLAEFQNTYETTRSRYRRKTMREKRMTSSPSVATKKPNRNTENYARVSPTDCRRPRAQPFSRRRLSGQLNAEQGTGDRLHLQTIDDECSRLCLKSKEEQSSFGKSDPKSLEKWSYSQQMSELQQRAPNLLQVLETAVNVKKASGKEGILKRKQRGIVSATGVLLQTRSKFTNSAGVHNGLILKRGGASEKTFKRLNDKGISVSYHTTLRVQKEMGKDHNREAKDWAHQVYVESIKEKELMHALKDSESCEEQTKAKKDLTIFQDERHPGFKIMGDNADLGQKARELSTTHRNPDHHFFNHAAIKNRVSGYHLSNEKEQEAQPMEPTTVLPGVEDNIKLREELIVLTAKVIAEYVPSLRWFLSHVPERLSHQYDSVASKKSEVVNLGVLLHNENTTEGITEIMNDMHQYVPGVVEQGEEFTPIISGGDLLTAERESNVQEDRRDAPKERRWGGLLPNIDDFHTSANAYKVGWDYFYSTQSARDIGTMYAARNFLGLTNVTTDPFKDYHAATELITRWTDSLIICATLTHFGMESVDDDGPTINKFDMSCDPKDYVYKECGKLLDKFAMVSGPTPASQGLQCPFCKKKMVKVKSLRMHIAENHEKKPPQTKMQHTQEKAKHGQKSKAIVDDASAAKEASVPEEDGVLNYSCAALSFFLLIRNFRDAVRRGDGERLLRIYKFLMLYFKASGKHKYAFQSLRLLVQIHHILPPRIAHQLMWNRFINLSGHPDSNFSMDLFLEFMNKVFKLDCRGFHGKITEEAVQRVSRAAQKLDQILSTSDREGSVKPRSGEHKKRDVKEDVLNLIKVQHDEGIFDEQPGRHHNAFPGFPRHPLLQLDYTKLQTWMKKTIKGFAKVKVFKFTAK